ncbi:MAG: ABC transporter ATP-binding protein [Candidatus Cloacimonetes bacterium]|nr:ABC transporter ATP-binding protein [Candidatus Cloacimonadota bacterium]
MKENFIEIKHVKKEYPMGTNKFVALKDIDLNFSEGEFTGIVGPSGSGKTTLLNIIGSLDSQSEGEVIVLGYEVADLSSSKSARMRSENIGFIFQTYNLLPVYTVFENVEFPLLLLRINKNERIKLVTEALKWVGLLDKIKSRPSQISGGECQRVAIARAIVKKPKLVLADEPTANLDADNSHNILKTMKKINEETGTTFIFATHDAKVIKYLKRKITLLDGSVAKDELVNGG